MFRKKSFLRWIKNERERNAFFASNRKFSSGAWTQIERVKNHQTRANVFNTCSALITLIWICGQFDGRIRKCGLQCSTHLVQKSKWISFREMSVEMLIKLSLNNCCLCVNVKHVCGTKSKRFLATHQIAIEHLLIMSANGWRIVSTLLRLLFSFNRIALISAHYLSFGRIYSKNLDFILIDWYAWVCCVRFFFYFIVINTD